MDDQTHAAMMSYARRMTNARHELETVRAIADNRDADPDCAQCGGLGWVRSNVTRPDQDGFGKLLLCECAEEARMARRREALEAISGLLPHERTVGLDDLLCRCNDTPEMIRVVRRFGQWPTGMLTLWGECGNGKTLCLQALVNHFREGHGWVSVYARFTDLIDWMRAGHASDAGDNARQRYEQLKGAQFLAIDEVDKARMTDYAHEFRTSLLDDRYRLAIEGTHFTALACNEDPSELPIYIYDRLRDGRFGPDAIFHNRDPSLRPSLPGMDAKQIPF
jgi:DNA replication protein DnaC